MRGSRVFSNPVTYTVSYCIVQNFDQVNLINGLIIDFDEQNFDKLVVCRSHRKYVESKSKFIQ